MDVLLKSKIKELETKRKDQNHDRNDPIDHASSSEKSNQESSSVDDDPEAYGEGSSSEMSIQEEQVDFSDYDNSENDSSAKDESVDSVTEHNEDFADQEIEESFSDNRQPLDNWVLRPINRDDVAVPLYPVNYIQKISPNLHFPISSADNVQRLDPEIFFAEEMFSAGNGIRISNITKLFVEMKIGCFKWLSYFDTSLKDIEMCSVPSLEVFFDSLHNGNLLCKIINKLWLILHPEPNEILCEEVVFVDVVSLKAVFLIRKQLYRILDCLQEKFGIPSSHCFQVNDLFNKESLLLVLISIKSLANCFARILVSHGKINEYSWPDLSIYEVDDTKSNLIPNKQAEYAVSDLDEESSHMELLVAFKVVHRAKPILTALVEAMYDEFLDEKDDKYQFKLKQKILQNHLAQEVNKIKRESTIMQSATYREHIQKDQNHEKSSYMPDVGHLSPPQINALQVYWWLCKMGVSQYYQLFLEDGWDSLYNVSLMTEDDICDLGITKRGHIKRFLVAIKEINLLLGSSNPTKDISGQFNKISVTENDKIWRSRSGFLPLSDVNNVWGVVRELRLKEKKIAEKMDSAKEVSKQHKDTLRAISILRNSLQSRTAQLVPLDVPIIIDVGWYTLKIGFASSLEPVEVPSLCSFQKGRYRSAGLDINLPQYDRGLKLRRVMHRGFDSIVEPNLIHYDDFIYLIKYVMKDILNLKSTHKHPVLVVCNNLQLDIRNKEKLFLLLFNKIKLKYVYISDSFTLLSSSLGVTNGIFLDIGNSRTTCAFVLNNKLILDTVVHSKLGLQEIIHQLMRLLVRENTGLEFSSVYKSKDKFGYFTAREFQEQILADYILKKFGEFYPSKQQQSRLKTRESFVSLSRILKEPDGAFLSQCLRTVCGSKDLINVGDTPRLAFELFFNEEFVTGSKGNHSGLLDLIFECVGRIDSDYLKLHSDLSIYVYGGGALIPGLKERLLSGIQIDERKNSLNFNVNILQNANKMAWNSARDTLKEPAFHSHWVEKIHLANTKSEELNSVDRKKLEIRCPSDGCFPLDNPEHLSVECNKSAAALHYLTSSFQREINTIYNENTLDRSEQIQLVKDKLNIICTILKKNYVKKERILEIQLAVSENFLLNFSEKAQLGNVTALDLIHSLPPNLKIKIQKFVNDIIEAEKLQAS